MRLIDKEGNQLGIMSLAEALTKAEQMGLDLVEIAPNATCPVCKVIDYRKYRYQIKKKEKEQKKSQHQVKVKEIKIKPNTDDHDIEVKLKHARDFISKGNKVRITCALRSRDMVRPEYAQKAVSGMCKALVDIATPEAPAKVLGRNLSVVLAPGIAKKSSKIV